MVIVEKVFVVKLQNCSIEPALDQLWVSNQMFVGFQCYRLQYVIVRRQALQILEKTEKGRKTAIRSERKGRTKEERTQRTKGSKIHKRKEGKKDTEKTVRRKERREEKLREGKKEIYSD